MKITDIDVYTVDPSKGSTPNSVDYPDIWTFVRVRTDEGVHGWGECTNFPGNGSLMIADAIHHLKPWIIGEDAADINAMWHRIFRKAAYLGPRGLPTAVVSGLDIALWDIKGKVTGRPIYDLLGGKVRPSIPTYANGWFFALDGFPAAKTPEEYGAAARRAVEHGHTVVKCDPFLEMEPYHTGYLHGQISPEGEDFGINVIAAMREAVGPNIGILLDAHGHYNVPTCVRICRRLEPYNLGWFEEPTPPESIQALRSVREQVNVPICVGERLYTRHDFLPLLEQHLTDYIMPDVVWTGGISELLRIATLAEAYHVPISPHNAMGPLQVLAGAHTMMTVPNFYRLEHNIANYGNYNTFIDHPLDFRGDQLFLSERPGLGVDFDVELLEAKSVYRRPGT